MKYSPKPKNKKCIVVTVVLLFTAIFLFAFAATGLTRQVALIQFIGVAFLAFASFFMIKSITVFTYIISPVNSDDETDYSNPVSPLSPDKLSFTVSKRFGKGKEVYLCQLDMASLVSVTSLSGNPNEDKKIIKKHGKISLYKHVATVGPCESVLLIFHKKGYDKTALIIEPDNSMHQYLRTVAEMNATK